MTSKGDENKLEKYNADYETDENYATAFQKDILILH